jgi:antitoxin ParD1/3/4
MSTLRNAPDPYARAGGPYADLIRELVESGQFDSPAEVVLEGLALLKDRELLRKARDADQRAAVQVGLDEADRGEAIPADDVFARLRTKYQSDADKLE